MYYTSSNKIKLREEKETTIKNIRVSDDRTAVLAERVTETKSISKAVDCTGRTLYISKDKVNTVFEKVELPLIEVSVEEIKAARRSETPTFVLKENGKYYMTQISERASFREDTILGTHQCSSTGCICRHMSAKSDEEGGCKKVRDYCGRIERYPFIKVGFETFNTRNDAFVVVKCDHHEEVIMNSKPLPKTEPRKLTFWEREREREKLYFDF